MRTINILILVLMMAFPWSLMAQTGFAKLPAREKTRLAQEEELASESDMVFQELMSTGMRHFEANRFEEAIETFTKAEEKRPLNVYPPVMIEDVKLAMELYVEPEPEQEAESTPDPEPETPQLTADERVAIMYEKEMDKVRKGIPPPPREKDPEKEPMKNEVKRDAEGLVIFEGEGGEVRPEVLKESIASKEAEPKVTKPTSITESKEDVKKDVVKAVEKAEAEPIEDDKNLQERLASEYKDGITEKVFKEGNKEVTQRIVVKDGLGNDYRRVKHPWGGVFYFKNGTSITQRVWDEETK